MRGNLLPVVALDLHRAVLRRASRTAEPLQVLRDGVELAPRQAPDDGHRLAAATSLAAKDAHDAVLRQVGLRLG
jgi:hypothetical protein